MRRNFGEMVSKNKWNVHYGNAKTKMLVF